MKKAILTVEMHSTTSKDLNTKDLERCLDLISEGTECRAGAAGWGTDFDYVYKYKIEDVSDPRAKEENTAHE